MEPTSLEDRCKATVQTLAAELGLKGMVDQDGNRVKITNQMVIDKVLEMRKDLDGVLQVRKELAAANAAIQKSRALCIAARYDAGKSEHLLDDLMPVLNDVDPEEVGLESDDSDGSSCSGSSSDGGRKRAREDPPEKHDEEEKQPNKQQKRTMELFDHTEACPLKRRIVADLADIPAQYGGLCKYVRFVGEHGARVVVVGWKPKNRSYPIVAVLESDLRQPYPNWGRMVIHHYAPEMVCQQFGLSIASSVAEERLRCKFWRSMGGAPRPLQAQMWGIWRKVEVTKWDHRSKTRPVVVTCADAINGNTVWNLPMNLRIFRELQ